MTRIGIGLYGLNGHQLHQLPANHPDGAIVAVAGIDSAKLPAHWRGVRVHASLAVMLDDPAVQLVSLCSPRRSDQAADAISCLEAGRHVYAEKPCAFSEADLDRILTTAARTGCRFHDQAGTVVAEPWWTMRRLVAEGAIGQVIQIWAQKSYPLYDWRPQDEAIDGGLLRQAGIHAVRMIHHVAQVRVLDIEACETRLGNPHAGDLRIAVALTMTLASGALAQATINYCQPKAFGTWGNDQLRLFGTKGLIEAVDGGTRRRLVTHERDHGAFPILSSRPEYHDLVLASIAHGEPMPWSSETELEPTRTILRAHAAARRTASDRQTAFHRS